MGVLRVLFLAVLVLLILWALSLPRALTTPPGTESRPIENLKLWAILALPIQMIIYAVRWAIRSRSTCRPSLCLQASSAPSKRPAPGINRRFRP